jgi:hypothetical protein
VDRAEKNAALVLGQQKTLTQVGQALRAINRQSADLLETAETVSSLKLQGGASAAELSAVGQLVMLTQRIGKSANEFLTTEGVSAEAVFLLGKDLNSFREITQGVINGNAELRLPGTRDPQVREKLQQLLSQYEQTRAPRPAPSWATCRAWCRRARRRPPSSTTPSRCAAASTACSRVWPTKGAVGGWRLVLGGLAAWLLAAAPSGCCACSCWTRPAVRAWPTRSARKPSARSRKPSA